MLSQVRAEYLTLLGAAAAGGAQDFPAWDDKHADFDESLAAGPDSQLTLLRDLGVA